MSKTQKATLIVQPEYAYGNQGFPPIIPPDEVLTFELELLDVGKKM